MSEWFDELRAMKKEHDCATCHTAESCPLKSVIPRLDEMIQYAELHTAEVAELLKNNEVFTDNVMGMLDGLGPIISAADIKFMLTLLLLDGYIRGRQYVEVPDAYRK